MAHTYATATTCTTAAEAETLCGLLRSEGIEAIAIDGQLNTVDPMLGPALGYIRVDVRREDLARALEVLRERVRKIPGAGDAGSEDRDSCPACGAPLPEDDSSCHGCGWSLGEADDGGDP